MSGFCSGSEPLKSRRRLLFRAMHGAAKSAPGGVTALAVMANIFEYRTNLS